MKFSARATGLFLQNLSMQSKRRDRRCLPASLPIAQMADGRFRALPEGNFSFFPFRANKVRR